MANLTKTTITDVPRRGSSDKDKFGLLAYEKGLETFLRGADTPITVALQGEWGSGKTSLMNVLHDDLCGEDGRSKEYYSVWINTWEYSLMRNSNEALIQILFKMTNDVVKLSSSSSAEVVKDITKGIIGLGSAIMRTMANKYIADGLGDSVQEVLTKDAENTVADLRKKLQTQINECIMKNPSKDGIIFFIDDLDRIDPPVAVELLELLKNLFTLEHCIFVLAIDYDVVIKGLKPKFGELTEKNEREFRSFFDKIIQVPFSMPVSQYSTRDYLVDELKRIGILNSQDSSDKRLIKNLVKAESLTIGPNPRSMKRFLNTMSLIRCINLAKQELDKDDVDSAIEDEAVRKLSIFLNLVIVGIQVAYPKIYQLLCIEPGFTLWDDTIASKMSIPMIDELTKKRLADFPEFDEKWEQVLYRLCLTDRYLHNNAINISQLFNLVRAEINELATGAVSKEETEDESDMLNNSIKEYIQEQLRQSSVTGFSAGDSSPQKYNARELMKKVQSRICEHLKAKFKCYTFTTPRVKYNGGIKTNGLYPDLHIWQSNPDNHTKIKFQFRLGTQQRLISDFPQFFPDDIPTGYQQDNISSIEGFDRTLFQRLFTEGQLVNANDCYSLWVERKIWGNSKKFAFALNFDVIFDNPDAFVEDRTLRVCKTVVEIFFDICFKLYK